ncbi:MAG: sigma-54-dependent Fis family transcriptional regulator [Acidobacteria bacterium]|nr:sigma-54-dependent Fis family transcriptional regulator [Acidobacteriota bacterium]
MPRTIVTVDDEPNIGRSLKLILEGEGYRVRAVSGVAEALTLDCAPDLWLLDVRLPDGSGLDLLKKLRGAVSSVPAIMISGHATIADAVEATRAGAFDFLEKPLARDRVLLAVKNALSQSDLRAENQRLRDQIGPAARMIGRSAAFERVVEQATLAARSDARVLLTGESGTGKELLAAHIHTASPFSGGPFVKVNCAAIPVELIESELFGHERGSFTGATSARRGKFELADGGTLFLDEVGDLHASAQAKLLRVLQEGEFQRVGGERTIHVQVRVVAATHRDLARLAAAGQFREDLYYRLSVMPIRVPPLRERPGDLRPLAEYFLEEFCARNNFRSKTFDPAIFEPLERHGWPGNARELRNIVERMAILSPDAVIGMDSIPYEVREAGPAASSLSDAREAAEREEIRRALEGAGWNVSEAARRLGIDRTNLHKKMRSLGVARV